MDAPLPLPHIFEGKVSPDVIGPEHDFGGDIGVRKTIGLRDFLLVEGITEEGMKEMDAVRKKAGLPSLWED
jgi:hypothetical protein